MEHIPEKITFPTNVPVRLELKFESAKPCKSQFTDEDQFLITTVDDRRAYLSPYAWSKIQEAGIKRAEPFTLCKTEVTRGNRRSIDWVVARVTQQKEVPAQPTVVANGVPAPTASTSPSPNPFRQTTAAPQPTTALEDALMTAILAAKRAEAYGEQIGKPVSFDSDAIRAMAISVLIGRQHEGRR